MKFRYRKQGKREGMMEHKNTNLLYADKVKYHTKHDKKHTPNGIVNFRDNSNAVFRTKHFMNSKEIHLIKAEEVKAEPTTEVNVYEMPEFVTAERVLDDETNVDTKKDIMLDGGAHDFTNVGTKYDKKDATNDQENMKGKSEIIIDSIKPTDPKTTYEGRPIGMKFLYQADKLSCVIKCHVKAHLQEAQRRVSL